MYCVCVSNTCLSRSRSAAYCLTWSSELPQRISYKFAVSKYCDCWHVYAYVFHVKNVVF